MLAHEGGQRHTGGMKRILLGLAVLALVGCATPAPAPTPEPTASTAAPIVFNQELHDELIAMFDRDQAGRLGGEDNEGDQRRTERLGEIVDEFGWPGLSLVGKDGEDAAWTIAQHSDLDPEDQARFLEELRSAFERGEASPGNLAYLEDRVAVAQGKPQLYGTQVGCGPDGPVAATPIRDEAGVEQRRKDAGLDPLADYLEEMAGICAEEF